MTVVDGRPELASEVAACDEAVRAYLRDEFEGLVTDDAFLDLLPGNFRPDAVSQMRVGVVLSRLKELAGY